MIDFSMLFFLPDNVPIKKMESGEVFFIKGFRGTGKTSLLRYFVFSQDTAPENRRLILFKSGLSEEDKLEISQQTGIEWEEVDSSRMEVSQNFKQAWIWFIFHNIGSMILERQTIASGKVDEFLTLLGLTGENPYEKILGFLPRIVGATVSIKANIGFFEGVLQGDLQKGKEVKTSLAALNRALFRAFLKFNIEEKIIIAFDELEAFFDTEERYKRDLRMARDIIFAITELNNFFRTNRVPAFLYAAIRTEVLDAMRVVGHEVEREAHDFGTTLVWHNAQRSIDHPLLMLVRRKIIINLEPADSDKGVISMFFPPMVKGGGT